MQYNAHKDTIVHRRRLIVRCLTTSVMQGFTAKLAQVMPLRLKTIVLSLTTAHQALAFIVTLRTTRITRTGEKTHRRGVPKAQDWIGLIRSARCLNVSSIRNMRC